MKLQICRPSFFDSRDAIIQADQELTGGENFCTLWEGFAARGLGPDATVRDRTPWGGGVRTDVSLLSLYQFFYQILTVSLRDTLFLWLVRTRRIRPSSPKHMSL